MDRSTVLSRDMLDDKYAALFPKPWLFETEDSILTFDTEDEACAVQREYRMRNGFDPLTGI